MLSTALNTLHKQQNAQMVDFSGWEMPIHYGSQLKEHQIVRTDCGIFDVSHMRVVDVEGNDSAALLRHLLANDVAKLTINKALYTCMLKENGGIIDDLIVYRLAEMQYRIILNASRRDIDFNWLIQHSETFDVQLKPQDDLCILAVQGPQALQKLTPLLAPTFAKISELKPFTALKVSDIQVARTGYTGEDGVEIILPTTAAQQLWQACMTNGIAPCGLGARDTLRLEAGLNLYGADMDEQTSPLVSNLAWTVSHKDDNRDFIGKAALQAEKQQGIKKNIVGLLMTEKGVLRSGQIVYNASGEAIGEITSGTFSPTLQQGIALARISVADQQTCYIDRRGKKILLNIIKPPFVRFGKQQF